MAGPEVPVEAGQLNASIGTLMMRSKPAYWDIPSEHGVRTNFGNLRHSYPMRLTTRVMAILGLVAFTVTAALGPPMAGASTSVKGEIAKAPITIHIKLDQTRVVAGTPIKGTAVLINNGSKAMLVQQCATDGWLAVGLANKQIQFSPGFALVACPPSVVLTPGPNRFPVKVSTSYESCLQPGGRSAIFIPKCVPRRVSTDPLPPLPAGRYSTKVVTMGLPTNTAISNSVVVTLR